MPHKRATRSTREQKNLHRGSDLAPKISIEHEPIPKSVSRVLDAGQIRQEYRKKRRLDGVSDSGEDNARRKTRRLGGACMNNDTESFALKITQSETIAQFNRRVETTMVPLIKTALRDSSTQVRRARREEAMGKPGKRGKPTSKARHALSESLQNDSDPPPATIGDKIANPRNMTKEFRLVSTSAPRRLNDVAREPPEIKKFPRGATRNTAPSGVLSMAQKTMMEQERDKAIRHYRELKARKAAA